MLPTEEEMTGALRTGTRPGGRPHPLSRPHGRPRVIAHRGASAHAPENTAVAARVAVALGADAVECDVHRTADGALVVIHDRHLRRTTDAATVLPGRRPWRVGDLTLEEIQRVDAGSWFHPSYAGEPVPTLGSWAAAVGTRAHLLLEIKQPARYPGLAVDLVEELRRVDALRQAVSAGRLVVQSFDRAWVEAFAELAPETPVGLLVESAPTPREIRALARFADQLNVSHWAVRRDLVRLAHDHGLLVHAWTPNSRWHLWRAFATGVDGVITDHPERALPRR